VAQLYSRALGSLLSPLTTRRDYGGGILTRLHTWIIASAFLFLFIDQNLDKNNSVCTVVYDIYGTYDMPR
jgi:hypothetical protein